MKIKNLDYVFSDAKGQPVITESGNLTLKEVCSLSLLTPYKDKPSIKMTALEKHKAFIIYKKFVDCKTNEIDLGADEIVEVKEAVGVGYGTLIMGQAYEIIEG